MILLCLRMLRKRWPSSEGESSNWTLLISLWKIKDAALDSRDEFVLELDRLEQTLLSSRTAKRSSAWHGHVEGLDECSRVRRLQCLIALAKNVGWLRDIAPV